MSNETPKEITFHFIKANDFRVIPATGVWGGVNPRGNITMTFFSERTSIPKKIVHELTTEGQLGDELGRDDIEGVVRDVHVSVVVDLAFAENFRVWLDDKIKALKNRIETQTSNEDSQ